MEMTCGVNISIELRIASDGTDSMMCDELKYINSLLINDAIALRNEIRYKNIMRMHITS